MRKSVLAQVADVLSEESAGESEVSLSQASLAALLGVSRQSVNEALGELRSMRIVETGYRRIIVLDPDALAAVAAEGNHGPAAPSADRRTAGDRAFGT